MQQSLPQFQRASSPFGSILGLEDFDPEVETVIGNDGFPTPALVREAHVIAKSYREVVLHHHEYATVYIGVLLEALLNYASKDTIPELENITGERYTAGVIYAAYQRKKVDLVARAWFEHMILPMHTAGNSRTTQPSEEQTPKKQLDEMTAKIKPASRNAQKQLRKQVLERHCFRCILHSREIDDNTPLELRQPADRRFGLHTAHILPFSLNKFSTDNESRPASAVTWTMINNWTSVNIQNLVGEGINDPTNAFLICYSWHDLFGKFRFFFEPLADREHRYVIRSPDYPELDGMQVDFRSETNISPPDPRYLAIHAAFAKVLRASAAAEFIQAYFRDEEDRGVLASDGSTDVSILLSRLHTIQVK